MYMNQAELQNSQKLHPEACRSNITWHRVSVKTAILQQTLLTTCKYFKSYCVQITTLWLDYLKVHYKKKKKYLDTKLWRNYSTRDA